MARIGFDLESLQFELERVADLLGIFQEFVESECPRGGMDKIDSVSAVVFASRADTYTTAIIDTAQEKVLDVVEKLSEIIDDCYAEARKAKGTVDKC